MLIYEEERMLGDDSSRGVELLLKEGADGGRECNILLQIRQEAQLMMFCQSTFKALSDGLLIPCYITLLWHQYYMGAQPNRSKTTQNGSSATLSFVCSGMQGWRRTMEDAVIHELALSNGHALFAVFDGHGGREISQYVSTIFAKELIGLASCRMGNYAVALDEAFKLVDELLQKAEAQQELRKIRYEGQTTLREPEEYIGEYVGCTANVVLITPTHYYIANAGDCRSVLSRGGRAIALSKDHRPESAVEQERIRRAGGMISMGRVNGGPNVARSFADFDYKRVDWLPYDQQMITCKPDLTMVERGKEDEFILMGSAGIWERYEDDSQGMVDIVRQEMRRGKSHVKVVEELLDRLLAGDIVSGLGCDNMTAILIAIKP